MLVILYVKINVVIMVSKSIYFFSHLLSPYGLSYVKVTALKSTDFSPENT